MSLRGRRIARRERREIARRAKLDRLREGRNLRVRPAWATVIQAFAFVRKELAEIIRQPRLLLLLVVGPFLLLVLFGAGYQDANVVLRTQFVGPEGSVYEQAITEYADQLEQYIDSMGFTSDVDAAVRRLEDEELDAVVVFPPDALDQILAGESAKIEVLHEKLDPFQQAAIEIASRLAVQEVNASVLGAIAAEAQDALAPVDQAAGELAEQASALSAAVAAGDTAAMATTAGSAGATLRDIQIVITGSQDVVRRLGGEPDDVGADALAQIDSAAAEAESISEGGGADIATQAGTLAATLEDVAATIPDVSTLDPAVLVRPFEAQTSSIAPVEIEPVDFFAPSAIALLLQHLALTFAALSLVRDRQLGLLELLRVGPLSSVEILVGKTVAYLVVGLAVGASLVAAAVYVLGVPLQGETAVGRRRRRSRAAGVAVARDDPVDDLRLGDPGRSVRHAQPAGRHVLLRLLPRRLPAGAAIPLCLLPPAGDVRDQRAAGRDAARRRAGERRPRRARRARRRLRFAGRAAAATEAESRMTTPIAPTRARTTARARAVFNRRRIGRAVTIAAVVAAVTCVIGAVVAWQLLGDLRTRSAASLDLLERTLINVDETLAIAQDVTSTVGDSLDTIRDSLTTLSAGVGDGAAALDSVADLTEDVPPALDRLDATLVDLGEAAGVVDSALEALDEIPIGPDFDADAGLAASVDGVRDDIRPIAEDLRGSTDSIRELSGSSDDLVTQLSELDGDLIELDQSLDRSRRLLDSYRADTAEAITLAEESLADLDRDIAISRVLAVVLALSIAVGQVAPFHIGRQLAATPDPQPGQPDALSDL